MKFVGKSIFNRNAILVRNRFGDSFTLVHVDTSRRGAVDLVVIIIVVIITAMVVHDTISDVLVYCFCVGKTIRRSYDCC